MLRTTCEVRTSPEVRSAAITNNREEQGLTNERRRRLRKPTRSSYLTWQRWQGAWCATWTPR